MANQSKTNIWIDGSQAGSTLAELKKSVNLLNREIKELPRNSDAYKKKMMELKDANGALNQHRNQIKGVSASYGQAQSGIGGMMKKFMPVAGVVGAISLAIGGLTSAVSSWYKNNKEMEKSLSSLKSLTGASAEDVKFYKNEAQEMGRSTTLSATQVVEAYKLIGSARPDLLKNKEALAAVTKETIVLAEASEMELSGAAQAMTGIMNQFGLGAESSKRIINSLAAGSKEGAADISSLSDTIDKSGAVMEGYNISVEQGIGLAETLAEKNIKGAEAGTQLRNVLLTMQGIEALPQKALDALEKYGVDTKKVADETVPFQERLKEMSKISGDATAMIQVFGKENIVAGKAILGNVDKVEMFTNAVTGTNVAYEQASINTDNLDGDLKSLGSAWEGLTLSMDGGSSVFRPIVQAGTDMLNWVTDTIKAFQYSDSLGMENSLLKLGKALTLMNPMWLMFGDSLRDVIDEKIRFNELTSAVIDGMKDEANSSTVLTEALKANNDALKNKNISDQQAALINAENEKIISTLNERYPDLTNNMDLNTASGKELSKLQKDINKNLLDQSINAVKAAEAERLLSEIVKNSMDMAEQRRTEAGRWDVTNWVADVFTDDAADMEENQNKMKRQLRELPETMKQVEKELRDINPEFGVAYKENALIVQEAWAEINKIKKKMKSASGSDLAALKAEEKGLRLQVKAYNKKQTEIKNAAIESKEAAAQIKKDEADTAKAAEDSAKRKEESNKKVEEAYKKTKEQLDSLLETQKKFQEELDYNIKLDAFTEEQEKELFALEHTLNAKYEKEIASATELSKKKGDIGIKATEALNALVAIKEKDLSRERLEINKKYATQKAEQDAKYNQESRAQFLQWEAGTAKSVMDLKVASAQMAVNAVADSDLQAKRAATDDLRKVLIEQAEFEKELQLKSIREKYINDDIGIKERKAMEEQLEIEHRTKIEEINNESEEKLSAMSVDRLTKTLETISSVIDTLSQFFDAAFQNRINQIDKTKNAEVTALDEQLSKGIITKEEYETKKAEIERKADEERKIIENDKAKKDRDVALAQAIISGALGVAKASPNVPLMILAGLTAAAQVAVIASTEIPQYADGGYTNVIGAKDGKMYNAKNVGRLSAGMTPHNPSLALISEQGPEYFVPNHLLQNQQVLNSVRVIEAIRTNQFAEGGFTAAIGATGGAMSDERLIAFLQANLSMLSALNSKIPNMRAVIDDGTVDAINTRTNELQQFRS